MLRGVDLEVATGEIMVVIGRSGGGKSVLLKHLLGLLRPDAGAILGGRRRHHPAARAAPSTGSGERYGVVFQGGALFDSMSVLDNVAFPLREKTRLAAPRSGSRVEEKLGAGRAGGHGRQVPGRDLGRHAQARGDRAGPGHRARDRLLRRADDGLDPILVNTIHHLIMDLHRKFRFTAVMVSHEIPEIFEIADRVAMLHEGADRRGRAAGRDPGSANPVVQQFIRGRHRDGARAATALAGRTDEAFGDWNSRRRSSCISASSRSGWLSVKLGRVDLLGGRGYVVTADFPSVGGLKAGSADRDRGRRDRAAWTRSVSQDYQARVVMSIQPGIKLQDDSIASIKTKGLIGEKYIRISPGGSDKIIGPERPDPRGGAARRSRGAAVQVHLRQGLGPISEALDDALARALVLAASLRDRDALGARRPAGAAHRPAQGRDRPGGQDPGGSRASRATAGWRSAGRRFGRSPTRSSTSARSPAARSPATGSR